MESDLLDRVKDAKSRIEKEKDTHKEAIPVANNRPDRERRRGVKEGMERALEILNEELTRRREGD